MKIEKRGRYDTQEELINRQFDSSDPMLNSFEVVPLDHRVSNLATPTFYISKSKLVFSYDDLIEIYALDRLILSFSGDEPKFQVWSQTLFSLRVQSAHDAEDIAKLRMEDEVTRFRIDEDQVAPRDFLLRKDSLIQRSYQTWAMGRIILNVKNGVETEKLLYDMLNGNFLFFNQKSVLYFAIICPIFFLVEWLITPHLPDIFGTIINALFVLVLLLMGLWLYLSFVKLFEKYEALYRSYSIKEFASTPPVTNL